MLQEKILLGVVLMAGIVLVSKPSFLFLKDDHIALNASRVGANSSNDWRNEYEKGAFFFFDLRSKF